MFNRAVVEIRNNNYIVLLLLSPGRKNKKNLYIIIPVLSYIFLFQLKQIKALDAELAELERKIDLFVVS
jgi:hypothetical protein